jgi:hypothetical protein
LSEQELRRIAQPCQENAPKIGVNEDLKIQTKLKDGSLVDYKNVDELLASENGGQKAVTRLSLMCDDGHEDAKSFISVEFCDGAANPLSWDSTTLSVVGESRDAVFVAAADLDDRVKKTQTRAWPHIVSRPWFTIGGMIVATITFLVLSTFFSASKSAVQQLQVEYEAGQIGNPIEAIIRLEQLKTSEPFYQIMLLLTRFVLIWGIVGFFHYFGPKIAKSYVFYWGDAVAAYDKTRGMVKVFWTTIVLGLVVSVLSGWMLQLFLQ